MVRFAYWLVSFLDIRPKYWVLLYQGSFQSSTPTYEVARSIYAPMGSVFGKYSGYMTIAGPYHTYNEAEAIRREYADGSLPQN